MPLRRCTVNGKKGWMWGTKGKCYTGKGGRAKAVKQARAIIAQQKKRGKTPI